jgi:hypothetical protein
VNNDELLDICHQIAARLKVVEDAIAANVRKDVAPTPAAIEEQEPQCPPGFKWDQGIQRCVEAHPAPAMEKATPAKLVKERERRIAQSI